MLQKPIVTAAKSMLVGVVVTALLVGCSNGGTPDPDPGESFATTVEGVIAELEGLSPTERLERLVAGAAQEGKVVMYSANSAGMVQNWNDRFKEKYPRIDAQFVRLTTPQALQRLQAETAANRPVADILTLPPEVIQPLIAADQLAGYVSPESVGFDELDLHPDGLFTVIQNDPHVIIYNTSRTQASELSPRIQDWVDPALQGRVGRTVNGGRWVAGLFEALGEGEAMTLLQGLGAMQPRVYGSATELQNAVISAQVDMGYDMGLGNILTQKANGAPVDYVVPEILFTLPIYTSLPKNAPHPYAAVLVYDWLFSIEGQQVLVEEARIGPRKDIAYPGVEVLTQAKEIHSYGLLEPDFRARTQSIFEELFVN